MVRMYWSLIPFLFLFCFIKQSAAKCQAVCLSKELDKLSREVREECGTKEEENRIIKNLESSVADLKKTIAEMKNDSEKQMIQLMKTVTEDNEIIKETLGKLATMPSSTPTAVTPTANLTDVNECETSPCKNDGSCTNSP